MDNCFLSLCAYQSDLKAKIYCYAAVRNQWSSLMDALIVFTLAFFSTSLGKSPCDVIGGTVKRLAACASLQAATSDQKIDSKWLL